MMYILNIVGSRYIFQLQVNFSSSFLEMLPKIKWLIKSCKFGIGLGILTAHVELLDFMSPSQQQLYHLLIRIINKNKRKVRIIKAPNILIVDKTVNSFGMVHKEVFAVGILLCR